MFAQVIQGRATDPAGLRKQWERWAEDVKPNAEGFLGSTAGITEDGEFIAIARFESQDAARTNSDRAEQGEWWADTEKYLEGVRFYDCTEVDLGQGGGSDDAGFVQVIQGTAKDKELLQRMDREFESQMRDVRPDVIGSVTAWQGNDFTSFVYFTSEAEAREGEKKEMPEHMKASMDEMMSLSQEVTFFDLKEPRLISP